MDDRRAALPAQDTHFAGGELVQLGFVARSIGGRLVDPLLALHDHGARATPGRVVLDVPFGEGDARNGVAFDDHAVHLVRRDARITLRQGGRGEGAA